MRGIREITAALTIIAFFVPAFATSGASADWLIELRSFDAVYARRAHIANAIGNAALPMMMVTLAQQRMVNMFGKMRAADEMRWAGYSDGNGGLDVVLVYPSVDKVAKMTLNHPGAEKISGDTVLLPADEGRPMPTYAVFDSRREWCAFARTAELARKALKEQYPACDSDLVAIKSGKASGAFDFDDKGFRFTARTVNRATAARLAKVPLLGRFAAEGVTHYVTFDDVKKMITALISDFTRIDLKGN